MNKYLLQYFWIIAKMIVDFITKNTTKGWTLLMYPLPRFCFDLAFYAWCTEPLCNETHTTLRVFLSA